MLLTVISNESKLVNIDSEDVIFICTAKGQQEIATRNGVFRHSYQLQDIEQILEDKFFMFDRHSAVNLDKVSHVDIEKGHIYFVNLEEEDFVSGGLKQVFELNKILKQKLA